jgi:hypothetical protein
MKLVVLSFLSVFSMMMHHFWQPLMGALSRGHPLRLEGPTRLVSSGGAIKSRFSQARGAASDGAAIARDGGL